MPMTLERIKGSPGMRVILDEECIRGLEMHEDLRAGKEIKLVLVDVDADNCGIRRAERGDSNAAVLHLRGDGTAEAVFFDFTDAEMTPPEEQ